jgi:hypothetical protein
MTTTLDGSITGTSFTNNSAIKSKSVPWSGAEWVAYFRRNAAARRQVPWELGVTFTAEQRDAIVRSLQAWQLGETSDGRHLRAAAERYGKRIGDPDYAAAVERFIREEQFHGESLGRVLDLAGDGRRGRDWGDRLFRIARYALTSMEAWTTPVIMVEVLATVYYDAIRRAAPSPVTEAVCRQILADEIPHLRFQCERLARIYRRRWRPLYRLTMLAHRLFFTLVVLLVWVGHRRALRAGGYPWRRFWRTSWARMRWTWRRCDPRRYHWPGP